MEVNSREIFGEIPVLLLHVCLYIDSREGEDYESIYPIMVYTRGGTFPTFFSGTSESWCRIPIQTTFIIGIRLGNEPIFSAGRLKLWWCWWTPTTI